MMTYSLTYNSCGRHNSSSREYNSQLEDIFSITRVEDIILLAGKTYSLIQPQSVYEYIPNRNRSQGF